MAAGTSNGMRTKGGGAMGKQGSSQMNSTKLGNNKRNKIAQICQKATVHQVSRFVEFTCCVGGQGKIGGHPLDGKGTGRVPTVVVSNS